MPPSLFLFMGEGKLFVEGFEGVFMGFFVLWFGVGYFLICLGFFGVVLCFLVLFFSQTISLIWENG